MRSVVMRVLWALSFGPPVMFDCYRTQCMVRAGIVNYDSCFIDTTKGNIMCILMFGFYMLY